LPTKRGFLHQYGHYNGALDYFTHERDGGFDWHRNDEVCRDAGYTTTLLGDEAVKLIEHHDTAKPLFLYVPFNAPHSPLQAPQEYLDRYAGIENRQRRTYAAMVSCVDDQIGRIAAALDQRGISKDTLIVFSSDNGGPTGLGATNGPLRDGKGSLYEGGVRVAAFATWPGQIKSGATINEPLHIVDWYPTLVKLAGGGGQREGQLPLDGRDAWPTIAGGEPSPHEEILLNTTPRNGAIRVGEWKLVVNGSRSEIGGPGQDTAAPAKGKKGKKGKKAKTAVREVADSVELFNLAEDLGEKNNLADEHPDKVRDLRARLDAYARAAAPPKQVPKAADFQVPKVWGE
jgi:arylsulfatase A-like enzyme